MLSVLGIFVPVELFVGLAVHLWDGSSVSSRPNADRSGQRYHQPFDCHSLSLAPGARACCDCVGCPDLSAAFLLVPAFDGARSSLALAMMAGTAWAAVVWPDYLGLKQQWCWSLKTTLTRFAPGGHIRPILAAACLCPKPSRPSALAIQTLHHPVGETLGLPIQPHRPTAISVHRQSGQRRSCSRPRAA